MSNVSEVSVCPVQCRGNRPFVYSSRKPTRACAVPHIMHRVAPQFTAPHACIRHSDCHTSTMFQQYVLCVLYYYTTILLSLIVYSG